RQQSHRELIQLEAQRQGVSALRDKDELERKITECNRQLGEKARPLLEGSQQISRNMEATQKLLEQSNARSLGVQIPLLDSRDFRQQAKAVANEETLNVDLSRLLGKDWVGIEQLEQDLDKVIALETLHRR